MKLKLIITICNILSLFFSISQNQLTNSLRINTTSQINSIHGFTKTGAQTLCVYKFNEFGDSVLLAVHAFTYNQDKQMSQVKSVLYDSCSIINERYLLPSGNYTTDYIYSENKIIKEMICKNSDGDTMEKVHYIHFPDSSVYEYQAMQNKMLTKQNRIIYYGIKNYEHTETLDDFHSLYFDRQDIIFYHADSMISYTWKENSWAFYLSYYFDFNEHGQLLQLRTVFPYTSSVIGYFYDSLFYNSDNYCEKIVCSLSIPAYSTQGKIYAYIINKNIQNQIIEKISHTYNDVTTFTFYGFKHILLYNGDGELTSEHLYKGLTQSQWNPYITYVYNETNIANTSLNNYISIFPNPASDQININAFEANILDVIIYDIMGKEIKRYFVNDNKTTLDVSALQSGLYVLKIKTKEGLLTRKVQIIR
ncbi:MAG TPA: T9SS type A sorting domain-containing protein [Bacteroidales bacterium]|nr:T9SS type A sorting domain-containing protein [Bacteroidales bacterium]HOR82991.1 T9SS type A sorting domain-containing protein [Bacteroidales bacterium]HPJ92254.1 T9SS type A sorting domain-containing protein [Bacteroidales bacterium]HQB19542.1 T9SS type A sorting domain-containing protein [Bacteroidales bacterium]